MGRVHRFRSIDRLLGLPQELEKQEIYFAHPSELNDPTEGILPFVWQGGNIIWTNFFRHYLYCLHWKCLELISMKNDSKFPKIPPPVMGDRNLSDIPKLTEIHKCVAGEILGDTRVREWIEFLSQTSHSMG